MGRSGEADRVSAHPRRHRERRGACLGRAAALALLGIAAASITAPAQQPTDGEADFDALAAASGLQATGALPFDFQHLAFLDGEDAVNLWAATSVNAGRVRGVFQGGWRYSLAMSCEFFRGDVLVAADTFRVEHVLNTRIPESMTDGFPLQAHVRLTPGEYAYRIEVRDLNWEEGRSVNERTGTVTVPHFDSSRPVVSSIAIAADTAGTWSPAPGIALKLNAAAIVQTDARPYVYFEVYGLTPGGDYRGDVRLVSTWASRGKGETFTGPRQPFRLQYRGAAPRDGGPVRSVFRLDMQETQPGPYEVRVKVKDLATGLESTLRRARLKVREPDRTRPTVPITEIRPEASRGGKERQER